MDVALAKKTHKPYSQYEAENVIRLVTYILLAVLLLPWLLQDMLGEYNKVLKIVGESLGLFAFVVFLAKKRLRLSRGTQFVYTGILLLLLVSMIVSGFGSVTKFDITHTMLAFRGTFITFFSYYLAYLLFDYFGEVKIYRLLTLFLAVNILVQVAQAVSGFGEDSQFGLMGHYTNNLNAFIFNSLIFVFLYSINDVKKKAITCLLVVSSILYFGDAALLIAIMLATSTIIIKMVLLRNKKQLATLAILILAITAYILAYPLYHDGQPFANRIVDAVIGEHSGGYLSSGGLVLQHFTAVVRVMQEPDVSIISGTGPASWGSRGAAILNERFNSDFLPQWRLTGELRDDNMSFSSLATMLVEMGLVGGLLYAFYFPVVAFLHIIEFSKHATLRNAETSKMSKGFRLALVYLLISLPYLMVNTQFNQMFICSFIAAFFGYLDWWKNTYLRGSMAEPDTCEYKA